ncbi:MAG TPA: PucR family transcriptional regulator ligand-binding domain-containing protein [Bacillales bacterium]
MLTVQDIVELDMMEQSKVKTAQQTLKQRKVESVSVIEIPVEDFVRKDEFVLSTGMGCGHDPELLENFVRDVLDSEPAALALATGQYISGIPNNVLELAERHHFPIIEVPWGLRFADITQIILQRINELRQREARQSEKIQQQLLNLILHGGDLSSIARFIQEKTRKPVIILDQNETIQGMSNGSDSLAESWENHADLQKPPDIIQIPIRSASHIQGTILFPAQEELQITEQENILLEHAATAAALWFLRDNAVKETEFRLRGDFVWNLARGEFQSWESARLRAQSLQFNIDVPYVCLFARAEPDEHRPSTELQIRNTAKRILHLEQSLDRRMMVTYGSDEIIVFLEVNDEAIMDTVHTFFYFLDKGFTGEIGDFSLSWGIGENQAGIGTFHEGYKSAQTALTMGSKQKGPGHRTAYGDIPMYRALSILSANEEIQEITYEVIGELDRYHREKGIDLLRTAQEYIRHKGNISKTSRALHLHRQSLVYRIHKIETLTKRSFGNPDDFFLFDLCIKFWEVGMSRDFS